jgi:hypothetical protein
LHFYFADLFWLEVPLLWFPSLLSVEHQR